MSHLQDTGQASLESKEPSDNEDKQEKKEMVVLDTVLCYLKGMYGRRSNSCIQETMVGFYSTAELEAAKSQLLKDSETHVKDLPTTVKAKHKLSPKKKQLDAGDLLEIMDNLNKVGSSDNCLPMYVTDAIMRIPAEDPDSTDPRVLQSEVKMLRREVQKLNEYINEKMSKMESSLDEVLGRLSKADPKQQLPASDDPPVAPPRLSKSKSPKKLEWGLTEMPQCTSGIDVYVEEESSAIEEFKQISQCTVTFEEYLCFFGAGSPLSNFYPQQVKVEGKEFRTAEHAYQYLCAVQAKQPLVAEKIYRSASPADAKKLGSGVQMSEAWRAPLVTIMERVVAEKFSQNADLRQYLLNTEELQLVEGSRDRFWGCGVALREKSIKDRTQWSGANVLGKTLMQTRQKLATKHTEHHFFQLDNFAVDLPEKKTHESEGLWHQTHPEQTYAEKLASQGPWNLVSNLKKRKVNMTKGTKENVTGLKGVERKTLAEFYVGQLDDSTTEEDFTAYITGEGIITTNCYKLSSRIPNTTAFRIKCDVTMKDKVLDPNTWPPNVIVRQWVRKPKVL